MTDYDEEELANVLISYINKYDAGIKDYYFADDYFDINQELNQTILVIENTILLGEEKRKFKKLNYPVEEIDYDELENYMIYYIF